MQELEYSQAELDAIRKEYAPTATDTQFVLFLHECKTRRLTPGKHIIFQNRRTQEWDPDTKSRAWVSKPVYITTIAALRLIAQRTGEYAGQGRQTYIYLDGQGEPTIKSNIPLPDPNNQSRPRIPWVVETPIYRKGFQEPMVGIARWDAVAAYQKSADGGRQLTQMWATRGPEQLAKCSEADGFRKIAPEELGQLYLQEELKPEEDELPVAPVTPASVVPLPPVAPPVNQTPAEPTTEPRPGESSVVEQMRNAQKAVEKASKAFQEATTKRTRKPKAEPVQQMDGLGITDEDAAILGTPAPEQPQDDKAGQAFAESVTSFTTEEAAAQGLPVPPDPIPSKEQKAEFSNRIRTFRDKDNIAPDALKAYFLRESGRTDQQYLTVGDWTKSLRKLDEAKAAGNLKQVVTGESNASTN